MIAVTSTEQIELLGMEEMQVAESPTDSPAMATGEANVEFLGACCRLMDLLNTPQDIPFLSGLIQREIAVGLGGARHGVATPSRTHVPRKWPAASLDKNPNIVPMTCR